MKIEIAATTDIVHFDGVPCRLWEGVTGRGIPCKVFVHRVAVHRGEDAAQFEAELEEQLPPRDIIPLRQIL